MIKCNPVIEENINNNVIDCVMLCLITNKAIIHHYIVSCLFFEIYTTTVGTYCDNLLNVPGINIRLVEAFAKNECSDLKRHLFLIFRSTSSIGVLCSLCWHQT